MSIAVATNNIEPKPQIDRRSALKLASVSLLGFCAACKNPASNALRADLSVTDKISQPSFKIGAQLYTYRKLFETDYKTVLKTLANIGYKDLEFAGYAEHNPREIKAYMNSLGLVSRSSHISLSDMRGNFEAVLDTAKLMGQTHLVLPWVAPELRNIDSYKSIAELLNKHGETAKKLGIHTAYHNHEFEFETLNGQIPYDVLLAETDPNFVQMQIDFCWSHKAGIDPVKLLKTSPGRFFGCHLKDMNARGEIVALGKGVINFKEILKHTHAAGITKYYVEDDTASDPQTSLSDSYTHLTQIIHSL